MQVDIIPVRHRLINHQTARTARAVVTSLATTGITVIKTNRTVTTRKKETRATATKNRAITVKMSRSQKVELSRVVRIRKSRLGIINKIVKPTCLKTTSKGVVISLLNRTAILSQPDWAPAINNNRIARATIIREDISNRKIKVAISTLVDGITNRIGIFRKMTTTNKEEIEVAVATSRTVTMVTGNKIRGMQTKTVVSRITRVTRRGVSKDEMISVTREAEEEEEAGKTTNREETSRGTSHSITATSNRGTQTGHTETWQMSTDTPKRRSLETIILATWIGSRVTLVTVIDRRGILGTEKDSLETLVLAIWIGGIKITLTGHPATSEIRNEEISRQIGPILIVVKDKMIRGSDPVR